MPLPPPIKGEKQSDYVSRCMSFLSNENSALSNEARLAACYSKYREAKKVDEKNEFGKPQMESGAPVTATPGNYPEVPEFPKNEAKPKSYVEQLEDELKEP